jgi:peptidyl-dipeptidase A
MNYFKMLVILFSLLMLFSCNNEGVKKEGNMDADFKEFAKQTEQKLATAYTGNALAYWNASLKSNDENWAKVVEADKKMNDLLSDSTTFNKLKDFKESGNIANDTLKRQLDVMYLSFLAKQIDKEKLNKLSEMQSAIENKYAQFRAEINGKKYSDNEVEEILKTSADNKELENIWKAHKEIGPLVKDDIIALVKLRNEIAKELGYDNYHTMSLQLSQQEPAEIDKLFDELDELTRNAFAELKTDIDTKLSTKYQISPDDMMPWHYQNRYFQEAPKIYEIDLDTYYEEQNIEELSINYFNSLGLEVNDIYANSDLYEKEGKNQHAYCINIDRNKKDVRMLCNLVPNTRWMETMLHETGHAVYEKYYNDNLPWTLKEPAHIFATEAIAMLFGRLPNNPQWMQDMLSISDEDKEKIAPIAHQTLKLQQLVFSRWAQVMYRFEKGMYANPEQDLNKLWWDLVEKYQMVKMPEGRDMPDWATKIHVATVPCYYHNYLLGELLASQLQDYIVTNVCKKDANAYFSFKDNKEVGNYLKEKVFSVGSLYKWNDMIEKATGEKLTAKYYAKQFVD